MKRVVKTCILILALNVMHFLSCSINEEPAEESLKSGVPLNKKPYWEESGSCDPRPWLYYKLVPVGHLSVARYGLVAGAAGDKILFGGGWMPGAHSSRVDIYDTTTKKWSKAELANAKRDGMVVASVGNKVLFAGGGDNDWVDVTSTVDIYDAGTNTWSVAELSEGRNYLTAATLGDRVFFAGGGIWGPLADPGKYYHIGSKVVDIYDNSTNTWSTASLSEGRFELSSAVAGKKIYFSGGINDIFTISKRVDIYDSETDSWSVSELMEGKRSHSGFGMDDKILWVAGSTSPYHSGFSLSNSVEIKDLSTGVTTLECIRQKAMFSTVITKDEVIFFTGREMGSGKQFDVYNFRERSWSVGVLPVEINGAAIICVGNTIYVAGGKVDGAYSDQVWVLEL